MTRSEAVPSYGVALCALEERDHRVLAELLSRREARRFHLVIETRNSARPQIAIFDMHLARSMAAYDELAQRARGVVPVIIADVPEPHGTWRYTIQRSSVMRSFLPLLNTVADVELFGSAAKQQHDARPGALTRPAR